MPQVKCSISSLYHHVVRHLQKQARGHEPIRPRHALLAPDTEVQCEAQRLAALREIVFVPGCKDLRYLLLPAETRRLNEYEALWLQKGGVPACMCPDCFFNLGDNPHKHISWSASGALPTFRTNAGILFNPWAGRWLTTNERFAALGFPVYQTLADAARCDPIAFAGDHMKVRAGIWGFAQVFQLRPPGVPGAKYHLECHEINWSGSHASS